MVKDCLKLVNVTAGYDLQKVLHGISLNIEEGSVAGIIGPNGHGKSTLVKTVSGLVSAWSGQVFFEGLPIEKMPFPSSADTISPKVKRRKACSQW